MTICPSFVKTQLSSQYHVPQEKVIREIVNDSKIDHETYISEKFDCDDFAHLLKAAFIRDAYTNGHRRLPYAFGILWGNKPAHAMNFALTTNGSENYILKLIELQTATLYTPSQKKLADIYLIIA